MAQDELSPRRQLILDAAIRVLASSGWRGLTHRAVDREARLPEGSTSSYFRSRQALHTGLAARVAHLITADIQALADGLEEDHGVEPGLVAATETFVGWLDPPDLLRARVEISLAATRDEALAQQLREMRHALVAIATAMLERTGRPHSHLLVETLLAGVDGVLMTALTRPRDEAATLIADVLRQLVESLTQAGRPADGQPSD